MGELNNTTGGGIGWCCQVGCLGLKIYIQAGGGGVGYSVNVAVIFLCHLFPLFRKVPFLLNTCLSFLFLHLWFCGTYMTNLVGLQ